MMDEGIIELRSDRANNLGFTPDKFDGYLWATPGVIWISLIISKHQGQGNVRALIQNILNQSYAVKVPTPSARMREIIQSMGFLPTIDDECKVWLKEPYAAPRADVSAGGICSGKR